MVLSIHVLITQAAVRAGATVQGSSQDFNDRRWLWERAVDGSYPWPKGEMK